MKVIAISDRMFTEIKRISQISPTDPSVIRLWGFVNDLVRDIKETGQVHFLFDSNNEGVSTFVEVEDDSGSSFSIGEWTISTKDGDYDRLSFPTIADMESL